MRHDADGARGRHLHESVVACLLICCAIHGGCASNTERQTESAHQASQPVSRTQGPEPEPQVAAARIEEALERIKYDYVDPVEDPQLVSGCKQGILQLVPTASIPEDPDTADGATSAMGQIANALAKAVDAVHQQGLPIVDDKLANACIEGMLKQLDGRSVFLDKDDFNELKVGGDPVGGVGIELGIDPNGAKIIAPIEGAPADRGDLRPGDTIIEIDSAPIAGLELKDVIKRLRGTPGTTVALTVARAGDPEPRMIKLMRAVIRIESVKYKVIAPGYAYIRVTQFQERTAEKMANAIKAMWEQSNGQIKGIILDLRNDPGGLLNAAVAVSAAFLQPEALVVYTDGRTQDSKMRLYASKEYYVRGADEDYLKKLPPLVKTLPMAVLVNGGSAAASEIVAGALQDHKRAGIVGVRTFGMGTVQTIFPLKGDTAMKLTTARTFRPSGQPISAAITPSFITDDAGAGSRVFGSSEHDQQLIQATRLLQQGAQ
jgi:carboxyl-terminal processing protease